MKNVYNPFFLSIETEDDCPLELLELKESIQKLNYELILGDWKLQHLHIHRHIRPTAQSNEDITSLPTLPSTGGNLLVHDRGVMFIQVIIDYTVTSILANCKCKRATDPRWY